jgi:hypothetical protein
MPPVSEHSFREASFLQRKMSALVSPTLIGPAMACEIMMLLVPSSVNKVAL